MNKKSDWYLIWCFISVFLLGFGIGGTVIKLIN